jgi:hypothetical protein
MGEEARHSKRAFFSCEALTLMPTIIPRCPESAFRPRLGGCEGGGWVRLDSQRMFPLLVWHRRQLLGSPLRFSSCHSKPPRGNGVTKFEAVLRFIALLSLYLRRPQWPCGGPYTNLPTRRLAAYFGSILRPILLRTRERKAIRLQQTDS